MTEQSVSIQEIGNRLKAFRLGKGLTPEELAKQIGISRAAIYRYEAGATPKVDTLALIAEKLGVTLTNILGIGTEYISTAVGFFERMRQLEADVDQISVLFGPISYLLTTDAYDAVLPEVLEESVPADAPFRENTLRDIDTLIQILLARKRAFRERKPSILSLVALGELEQFVRSGFVGSYRPDGSDLAARRKAALTEVNHILDLLADPPIGVQIGLVVDSLPGSSFQLFRSGQHKTLCVSPYRLGAFPNVRIGVATVTSAAEAIALHTGVTDRLWRASLKADDAIRLIRSELIDKYR